MCLRCREVSGVRHGARGKGRVAERADLVSRPSADVLEDDGRPPSEGAVERGLQGDGVAWSLRAAAKPLEIAIEDTDLSHVRVTARRRGCDAGRCIRAGAHCQREGEGEGTRSSCSKTATEGLGDGLGEGLHNANVRSRFSVIAKSVNWVPLRVVDS